MQFQKYFINKKNKMSVKPIENINLREKTMKNALQTVMKTMLKYFSKKKKLKLAKKLKNKNLTLEIVQKIFHIIIKQSVDDITVIDFLNILSFLHQMMFQNFFKDYDSGKSTQIKNINKDAKVSTSTIQSVKYNSCLKLFLIDQLRFPMQVKRQEVELILDDKTEINCILHFMTLSLDLIIKMNVRVHMQTAEDH